MEDWWVTLCVEYVRPDEDHHHSDVVSGVEESSNGSHLTWAMAAAAKGMARKMEERMLDVVGVMDWN